MANGKKNADRREMGARVQGVYEYVLAYMTQHGGNSPHMREIAVACGLTSTSIVARYLEQLEDEGKITMVPCHKNHRGLIIQIPGYMWVKKE